MSLPPVTIPAYPRRDPSYDVYSAPPDLVLQALEKTFSQRAEIEKATQTRDAWIQPQLRNFIDGLDTLSRNCIISCFIGFRDNPQTIRPIVEKMVRLLIKATTQPTPSLIRHYADHFEKDSLFRTLGRIKERRTDLSRILRNIPRQ